ncbi:MAG: yfhQ [Cyanobacteria bacterium RYN_339]|nr:yfhQ [Cyanobacteria bacterium RYN_339]
MSITQDLQAWYAQDHRDLPWRRTRDPYAIWISEIMLQQTQVATVIPYYERFMARFPGPAALAEADEHDVLKHWEGLGYYSRARHLQAGARMVQDHHGGLVPRTWDEVRRLPGVGDYTAGAILSIAFGESVPAVDGNVIRVLSRIYLVTDDVAKPATRKHIEKLARELLVDAEPAVLNQALMELGARVCTPAKPKCETCPVQQHCRAFAAGVAADLPYKPKKQAVKALTLATVLVERGERFLLVRRPAEGVWGGLWALPSVELPPTAGLDAQREALAASLKALGVEALVGDQVQAHKHALTHRALTIPVFRAQFLAGAAPEGNTAWVHADEAKAYALPVPFQRIVAAIDPGPLFRAAERENVSYMEGSPP